MNVGIFYQRFLKSSLDGLSFFIRISSRLSRLEYLGRESQINLLLFFVLNAKVWVRFLFNLLVLAQNVCFQNLQSFRQRSYDLILTSLQLLQYKGLLGTQLSFLCLGLFLLIFSRLIFSRIFSRICDFYIAHFLCYILFQGLFYFI